MPMPMQLQTVGEIVRLLRTRRDLEQIELARACGWRDASAVSRIETDRIAPTRRTLIKLADNLGDGVVNGSSDDVRAWLFLAAGILPTADDIARVSESIPAIEGWAQPALVLDFGWNVWRANHPIISWLALPPDFVGSNLLEIMFGDTVRAHLGSWWTSAAVEALRQFRGETDNRRDQRWHRALLARLNADRRFAELWDAAVPTEPNELSLRTRESPNMDPVSIIRITLAGDPRLTLAQIVPEARSAHEVVTIVDPSVNLR